MGVSAVVVSYQTGPVLTDCLAALAREPIDEILVVDNGNPAKAVAWLDALSSANTFIRVIRGQGNIGFAAACNLAAACARGDKLLFVNPDAVLVSGAVERLVCALDEAPSPAIIGGDLRDSEGRPERGSRRDRITVWRAFVSFTGLSRFGARVPALRNLHRHEDSFPVGIVSVGAVSGALMIMRRVDFESIGGFDDGYFLHVEDVDLCRRVEEVGGQVLYLPGPHGLHVRSSSNVSPAVVARYKANSLAYYFRKFARNDFERACGEVAMAVLAIILLLRARI